MTKKQRCLFAAFCGVLLVMALDYLGTAFITLDVNPLHWGSDFRKGYVVGVCLLGICAAIIAAGITSE